MSAGDGPKGRGFLRRVIFPDWRRGFLNAGEGVAIAIGAFGFWSSFVTLKQELALTPAKAFATYLWCSLIFQAVVCGALVMLFRALSRLEANKAEVHGAVQQRETGLQLLHKMSEEIRKCTIADKKIDCQERLQWLLGSELRNYLRARLDGGAEIAVTVKHIFKDPDTGKLLLRDLFRDMGQDQKSRPLGQESLEDNYIFQSFQKAGNSQWVIVRDTEKLDPQYGSFRTRADKRRYRSLIAFPLNLPNIDPGVNPSTQLTPLIGFLGLDSPHPSAFDGFFELRPGVAKPEKNNGEEFDAKKEMHLFYGLADSMATIVHLNNRSDEKKHAA